MKIQGLTYHRNGVCGNGFYSAIVTGWDKEYPDEFLVTWEPEQSEDSQGFPTLESCRAVYLSDPTMRWRGDEMAEDVAKCLEHEKENHNVSNVYDLTRFI